MLFNRRNVEETRAYFKKEHDLGINLPVWHFEEKSFRRLPKYKFLTATYTWNKHGFYVVEGEYIINNEGITNIIDSGILIIWESLNGKKDKQFKFEWLLDNSMFMRSIIYK
jgi:hypothetical protein